MKRVLVCTFLLSLTLSGCSFPFLNSSESAESLVAKGCAIYNSEDAMSKEVATYFERASKIDEKYRPLALAINSLQLKMPTLGAVDNPEAKYDLALKALDEVGIVNSFC
jgi:hypothetical protein